MDVHFFGVERVFLRRQLHNPGVVQQLETRTWIRFLDTGSLKAFVLNSVAFCGALSFPSIAIILRLRQILGDLQLGKRIIHPCMACIILVPFC